jgi:hypothetical protein
MVANYSIDLLILIDPYPERFPYVQLVEIARLLAGITSNSPVVILFVLFWNAKGRVITLIKILLYVQ